MHTSVLLALSRSALMYPVVSYQHLDCCMTPAHTRITPCTPVLMYATGSFCCLPACSCVSGCKCKPVTIDAHTTSQESQTYFAPLSVTTHPECVISVVVSSSTSSGKHKFKVSGVMVTEPGGYAFEFDKWGAEGHY